MTKARFFAAAILAVSSIGVGIVKHFEGREHRAYVDPVGVVTVCDGHTATARLGQVLTDEMCDVLLREDLKVAESAVRRLVKVPLTQSMYDALVSFTFNVGEGNLASSTLLRKLNSGDYVGACKEMTKWVYARKQLLRGLERRRVAEQALCLREI